ncbi:MAG: cation diffusion facilitator family transporter [Dehalococcoidales bacterium]|jgi:cobalt-zinc-cadmium efflux system protein|nr:cation diffusion facilitator family transporter [Dehalococcoidales bacterium]
MNHNHKHEFTAGRKLKYAVSLSVSILVAEIIGGILSNSLALLSDAGHVLADIIALGLSWYGVRQAERPANSRMTFGYHRVGVLVAIINASAIFLIAAFILYEAYNRFQEPPEVKSQLMMIVALAGLIANIIITTWLRKEQRENINIRSAFWHAAGDALASVGVIIGGLIILLTGQFWVDPAISVLISLIILWAAWSIFREGIRVLLEATPRDVDVLAMINTLKQIPGVKDIHDVHVWSITPELRAMNGHVLIEDVQTSKAEEIRARIEKVVREQYRIGHTTLQMECQKCESTEAFCRLDSTCPPEKPEKSGN